MVYDVEIPANTSATVTLPKASVGSVMMNNLSLNEDVNAKQTGNGVSLELNSGTYHFSYSM